MQKLNEMAYPSRFSFEELNNLRTYAAKKRYIESHLEKIGSGTSRLVYKVDEEKVLKLAKNAKGLSQNEEEVNKSAYDLDIFANVFDYDDEFYWIEMEIARKPKKSDVKAIYGISFDYIVDFLKKVFSYRGADCNRLRGLLTTSKDFNKFWEDYYEWEAGNPTSYFKISDKLGYFLKSIDDYIGNYSCYWADLGDLRRLANWGIVSRDGEEELVVIDAGLNDEIYNNHYNGNKKRRF